MLQGLSPKPGPIAGSDFRQRIEAWHQFRHRGQGLLEADWGRWWVVNEPSLQDMQCLLVETLSKRCEWQQQRCAKERVKQWRISLRKSCQGDESALCKWVRHKQTRPINHICTDDGVKYALPDIIDALEDFWINLFNLYSVEIPPSWEAFARRYQHVLPTSQPCKLPAISASEWQEQIRKVPSTAGKGTDGWRPRELQRLPLFLRGVIRDFFEAVEQGMQWPEGLSYIQVFLPPKGETPKPGKQRPISVFGILYRRWSSMRFRHMEEWREQWMPANMRGARAGGSTHDISFMLSLEVEMAQLEGRSIGGFLFDREKCFDRLTFDITDGLATMSHLSRHVKRFLKVGRFVGKVFRATNAMPQGCCWSILSTLLHMTVRHRDLAVRASRAITFSFYDDSSTHGPDADTLSAVLQASLEFDAYTGGLLSAEKSVAFAVGEKLREHLQQQQLYGKTISVVNTGKLLGDLLVFGGDFPEDQQNERLLRVVTVIRHIRRTPGPQQVWGQLVDIFAGAAIAFGTEHGGYSVIAKQQYIKVLRQTLWKCNHMWPNMAVSLAILDTSYNVAIPSGRFSGRLGNSSGVILKYVPREFCIASPMLSKT